MEQLRTANKRRKRAIIAAGATNKAIRAELMALPEPTTETVPS